jgi:hypothetical protein
MAKILENIKGSHEYTMLLEYMKKVEYDKLVHSSYAPKRLEKWFGYYSNLQSIKDGRHELGYSEAIHYIFNRIKNDYYPESDSILLCYGQKPESDTSIGNHRDHGCFLGKAVMINFGTSIYTENPYNAPQEQYDLTDGDVIEIDTKLIHSSTQISDLRMNATLRKVRPEFLPKKTNSLF